MQSLSLTGSKLFKTQAGAAEHKHRRITGITFSLAAAKQVSFGVQCLVIAKYAAIGILGQILQDEYEISKKLLVLQILTKPETDVPLTKASER